MGFKPRGRYPDHPVSAFEHNAFSCAEKSRESFLNGRNGCAANVAPRLPGKGLPGLSKVASPSAAATWSSPAQRLGARAGKDACIRVRCGGRRPGAA
jgi:hypothetical protein